MDWSSWINALFAGLSLAFAVTAWWRSTISKNAKAAAIKAEEAAARHLAAAEETAAEMRRIADQIVGPPIVGELHGEHEGVLRNRRDEPLAITAVLNRGLWADLMIDDVFTIPSQGSMKFSRAGRHPREIVLQLADGRVLHVAL